MDKVGVFLCTGCETGTSLKTDALEGLAKKSGAVITLTYDPKAGACGSIYNITQDPRLNHRIERPVEPFDQLPHLVRFGAYYPKGLACISRAKDVL